MTDLEPYVGKQFLRVADAARVTESDPRTIRRSIDLGQIEAIRLGDATVRIPAAPFWRLCGLDPETLRPLDGGHQTDSDAAVVSGGVDNVLTLQGVRRDQESHQSG